MRSIFAVVLGMTLVSTGCAQRSMSLATQPTVRPYTTTSRVSTVQRDPEDWRRYITNLPIGTKLTIDLADGVRLNGNILSVEQDALIMQPRTRLPSPPRRVPFDTIVALAPQSESLNAGKAIAIGAVAGAAAFTAFFVIVWAALGD